MSLALKRAFAPLLVAQAIATRRRALVLPQAAGPREGRLGASHGLRSEQRARHVLCAPLPPIHRFALLPQPLPRLMGADARRHDEALAHWAAGRENVSHIGIALELDAGAMARDGFHPGEPVYRICGAALALHIADDVWAALTAGSGDGVHRAREGTTTEGRRT